MAEHKLQVPIVVGTRPEAIKLVSLILALRESENYNPIVVSTGQHNRLVEYIFELADIKPDVTLWAGSRRAALNERVAAVMQRFEDFCVERFDIDPDRLPTREDVLAGRHPALVMVHGDTSSAMAAALAAFHMRIPVMHVEAGLRTGGNNLVPFPEELNRQVISTIAAMHFAPTSENLGNLVRENIPVEQVFVTGNTGIDALHWSSRMNVDFANPELQALVDSDRRIVVVTAHRRENWGDGLRGIAEGIHRLADRHPEVGFVLPVHPNPRVREVLTERLRGLGNVLLAEPLGYATFARLLGRCHLVITDSGGIQEEAPSLGKPVLVTRETTERTEGIAAGTLRLVGTNPQVIFDEADRLLASEEAYRAMAEAENPYGDGHAAERIVAALEHLLLGTNPPAQFGTGYSRAAVAIASGMRSGREVGIEQLRAVVDEATLAAAAVPTIGEAELEEELVELDEAAHRSGPLIEG
ncbi:MAG TPA: UDP-N-acetylglucosamine 2-epimerase (non-hydrolyzing) [Solirubrobacterales bacterium]|nr:UDP-N-acetylglucosamine 2-epimerase (non-hydrolyzing) [Solirubrobacterales bacterium]